MESRAKKNLLIGLGNTLLKDDGVGVYADEKIKEMHPDEAWDIEVSALSGGKLLEIILGYRNVIVVDSILIDDRSPGEIITFDISEMKSPFGPSPHYMGLPHMLATAKRMNLEIPEKIRVVAINVKDPYTFHEGLSSEIEKALPRLVEEIEHEMISYV
ncbi:MAG: hydrogenase maturation protease [Acidobacteriota bacterium]